MQQLTIMLEDTHHWQGDRWCWTGRGSWQTPAQGFKGSNFPSFGGGTGSGSHLADGETLCGLWQESKLEFAVYPAPQVCPAVVEPSQLYPHTHHIGTLRLVPLW